MKIIPPSYEILDTLDQQSLAVRIEFSGRICYKSEDKIDKDSALPFVSKMAEHGHNSVLEMGVLSLQVRYPEADMLAELYATQPRYLQIDTLADDALLVTGSVRAFREMLMFHPGCRLVQGMTAFLAERHPYFFSTIIPAGGFQTPAGDDRQQGPPARDRQAAPTPAPEAPAHRGQIHRQPGRDPRDRPPPALLLSPGKPALLPLQRQQVRRRGHLYQAHVLC